MYDCVLPVYQETLYEINLQKKPNKRTVLQKKTAYAGALVDKIWYEGPRDVCILVTLFSKEDGLFSMEDKKKTLFSWAHEFFSSDGGMTTSSWMILKTFAFFLCV